jgi:Fe-S cluster assembly protein SufD
MSGDFLPNFDEAAWALFRDAGPATARAARRTAWDRYAAQTTPNPRAEAWVRSDPALLDFASLRPAPPAPWLDGPPARHALDAAFDVVIAWEPDGLRLLDRSGVVRDGRVSVGPLESPEPEAEDADKLEAAAGAFWNAGISLRVARGAELPHGLLVRGRPGNAGSTRIPRIEISAGAGSRFVFAHVWEKGAASSMLIGSLRLRAEEGARVRGVFFQDAGPKVRVHFTERLTAARDAAVEWTSLQRGGAAARLNLIGSAAGPGAELRLRGLCLADGRRQIEQVTRQDHPARDATSHLLFKSVVRDEARSVFRGVIRAHPGAVRIDAFQKNDHLVLDPSARAESLPGLLIDADDLKCTHGATVGHPDPDALFYLRSRGLPLAEARALLVEGFSGEILAGLPSPALGRAAGLRFGFRDSLMRVKARPAKAR